jgi:signal transduction histidine kinase
MRQTAQAAEFKKGLAAARLSQAGLATAGVVDAGLVASNLAGTSMTTRKRVEAMVETLANLRSRGESLAEVAHDARNMVTALGLYCDLLEEPGVLTPGFHHYAGELRLVATASRRLVEKLLALDSSLDTRLDMRLDTHFDARLDACIAPDPGNHLGATRTGTEAPGAGRLERASRWDLLPAEPIDNLAGELTANRNLLSALAGPSISLTVDAEGGALPVRLTGEDLTRILVNLVKNAAEALPAMGRIALSLHEFHAGSKLPPWLVLSVEDNGPGIPSEALEKVFDSGYTTRASGASGTGASESRGNWPASHRGLGLSITRSIVESAGGSIHASNRAPTGACFKIELPIRSR